MSTTFWINTRTGDIVHDMGAYCETVRQFYVNRPRPYADCTVECSIPPDGVNKTQLLVHYRPPFGDKLHTIATPMWRGKMQEGL